MGESQGWKICEDAPFHIYFSDAKYDAIGMIPRERLKTTSLYSAPVLWMESVMGERNLEAGFVSYPSATVCVQVCAETPRALILR